MSFQIVSASKNITALNDTISDPSYFNELFKTDDCVVTQIPDPTPDEIAAQQAQAQADQQAAQAQAVIDAQIEANRVAYLDALIAGDTTTQDSIVSAQASLMVSKNVITGNKRQSV
jgi:hypothetical protein